MPALTLPLPVLLAMLTAISPLAVDMYLPAMAMMASDLHTDIHWVELSVSAYLLGFAIGQLSGGPLSDRWGRKPLIISGLMIFTFTSFLLVSTADLTQLLWLRVLQALGGGLATVNAAAIVRDLFRGADVARTLSMVAMITMMAPLLAPVLGALTLNFSGWRTIFLTLTVYGGIALLLLSWQLPESHPPAARHKRWPWQDYQRVITHVRARRILLALSLSYSGMFIFITASPYLYLEHFGQSPERFPWLFGANILVMMTMNRLNIALLNRYHSQVILRAGLILQAVCALLLVLSFTLLPGVSLWLILPLIMVFIGSLGLIGANAIAMVLHHFRDISATANALAGVLQFCGGALAGLIWSQLHDGSPLPMVGLMLVTATVALLMLFHLPSEQQADSNDPVHL